MPQAVRFTEKGETFDVPVAEAAKLADQLEQGSDNVTESGGGLAALIRDVIESGREPIARCSSRVSSRRSSSTRSAT